jgi:Holliday junction DNA helicase RuvA
MISYICGELVAVEKEKVILDVQGIGYGIFVSEETLGALPRIGEKMKLHTYLNVKEDAMQLYGFLNQETLEMFRLLITVSGIGPKGALHILSTLGAMELRFAVLAGDAKKIATAPGVGKKTAEKLILELKDKFQMDDTWMMQSFAPQASQDPSNTRQIQNEVVEALVALGYQATESLQAVRQVDLDTDNVEDWLKAALKKLY